MSISTTTTTASFVGNGSTSTPYPLTGINYVSNQHIKVYADGVLISTDEAVSDYCTFAGDGTTGAGQFTTSLPYADTVAIEVFLTPALDQPVSLQETGSLPAKTLENQGFDRLNMQIRWLARKVANCFTLGSIEDSASTGTADNLIGFDGSGDIAEIPNTTFLQQDNNLSELANAPDQAAAQTNLGVDPAGTDNSTDVTKTGAGTYVSLAGQVLTVDEITEGDLNASINASLDKADTSVQVANNLSDVDAATAQTNLGVDAAGTDNSTDVTKAGTGTYVSLDTGTQVLTVDPIDEADLNASINLSLDKADTALQSGSIFAADVSDFEAAVTANTSVAANTAKISATAANVKAGVEGASITDAGTPAPTDQFLYRDAVSGDLQSADFSEFGAAATDGDAIHKSSANEISALTDKPAPVSGDFLVIEDSAAGNVKKSVTLGNLPLPASGTITEAMLNTSINDSLDLADSAIQTETNGTVQSGGLAISATNEGTVAGDVRGDRSVDLQTRRVLATQVASGLNSALLGGQSNTASGTNSVVLGGVSNVADGTSTVVFGNQNISTNGGNRNSILGGISNDITSTADNNTVIGGTSNEVSGNSHNIVAGGNNHLVSGGSAGAFAGARNIVSGASAVALGGSDCQATATDSLVAGDNGRSIHNGARVFADSTNDDFPSIIDDEFAIQGSALRLVDTFQGAGKVLTSDVSGSGNWAALPVADTTTEGVVERATQAEVDAGTDTSKVVTPETLAAYSGLGGISYASYSVVDGSRTSNGILTLVEGEDPDGIGTVNTGTLTLVAGTYFIAHSGEYHEHDTDTADHWDVQTRYNGAVQASFRVDETGTPTVYRAFSTSFSVTSVSSQTVDIFASETSAADILEFRNVKLTVIKLA